MKMTRMVHVIRMPNIIIHTLHCRNDIIKCMIPPNKQANKSKRKASNGRQGMQFNQESKRRWFQMLLTIIKSLAIGPWNRMTKAQKLSSANESSAKEI